MAAPITIRKGWQELLTSRGRRELTASLPSFLACQRWYGAKDRTINAVHFEALEPFREPARASSTESAALFALVRTDFAAGGAERYFLPLVLEKVEDARHRGEDGEDPVVAPLGGCLAGYVLADGASSPVWVKRLIAAFAGENPLAATGGGELQAATFSGSGLPFGDVTVRAVAGEQSNTSVRVNDRYLLKYYRRVESGLHPELEIGRFLCTTEGTSWTPGILGGVEYRAPADVETTALLVLTEWIGGARSGWDVLRGLLADADNRAYELAERLGRLTLEMHDALCSGPEGSEFTGVTGEARDSEQWAAGFRRSASATLDLIAGAMGRLPDGTRLLAKEVLANRPQIDAVFAACEATPSPGLLLRVHGDYHLGQVLCVGEPPQQLYAIDLEGEPVRSLAERRKKWPREKDLAGMIRSFAYAVQMQHSRMRSPAVVSPERTCADLVERFLGGYRVEVASRTVLRAFVLDKALYEVRYELQSRPEWVHIPLQGVLASAGA